MRNFSLAFNFEWPYKCFCQFEVIVVQESMRTKPSPPDCCAVAVWFNGRIKINTSNATSIRIMYLCSPSYLCVR